MGVALEKRAEIAVGAMLASCWVRQFISEGSPAFAAETRARPEISGMLLSVWLGDLDSNQGWRSQSPLSYR